MKIIDDTIHFESTELNYNKEKQVDKKQNTVRRISPDELHKYNLKLGKDKLVIGDAICGDDGYFPIKYICIHCGAYSFRRELTDVTYWDERYIFSWKCSF